MKYLLNQMSIYYWHLHIMEKVIKAETLTLERKEFWDKHYIRVWELYSNVSTILNLIKNTLTSSYFVSSALLAEKDSMLADEIAEILKEMETIVDILIGQTNELCLKDSVIEEDDDELTSGEADWEFAEHREVIGILGDRKCTEMGEEDYRKFATEGYNKLTGKLDFLAGLIDSLFRQS